MTGSSNFDKVGGISRRVCGDLIDVALQKGVHSKMTAISGSPKCLIVDPLIHLIVFVSYNVTLS